MYSFLPLSSCLFNFTSGLVLLNTHMYCNPAGSQASEVRQGFLFYFLLLLILCLKLHKITHWISSCLFIPLWRLGKTSAHVIICNNLYLLLIPDSWTTKCEYLCGFINNSYILSDHKHWDCFWCKTYIY